MSTNFYVIPRRRGLRWLPLWLAASTHPAPSATGVHLGKSAYQCPFIFRGYPDGPDQMGDAAEPVTDFASWKRLMRMGPVYDEYGHFTPAKVLLETIEHKREYRPSNEPRSRFAGGGELFIDEEFG